MKFKLFVWICSIAFPFRTCSPFYSLAHYNIIIRFCHYTAGIKNRAQATGGAGARGLQFLPGCSEAIDPEWRLPGSTLAGRCFSSYDMSAKRSERDLNTRPLSRITGFQGLPISSCGITAQYPGRESNPQALRAHGFEACSFTGFAPGQKYRRRDSNPQNPVPETGAYSFPPLLHECPW